MSRPVIRSEVGRYFYAPRVAVKSDPVVGGVEEKPRVRGWGAAPVMTCQ